MHRRPCEFLMASLDEVLASAEVTKSDLVRLSMKLQAGLGYKIVKVPARRRSPRIIVKPNLREDRQLKQLAIGLEKSLGYRHPEHVHGFVKKRSIATNAGPHCRQEMVVRVDLEDFFASISQATVEASLTAYLPRSESSLLARSLSLSSLPAGFSTSPLMSNVVFHETDKMLSQICARHNIVLTRYADDLTFSGSFADLKDDFIEGEVYPVLETFGWAPNLSKTRYMRKGKVQVVTGLSVSDEVPHVPRWTKRWVRQQVYFARRFGLGEAVGASSRPWSWIQMNGLINFIKNVDPHFGGPLLEEWRRIPPPVSTEKTVERWAQLLIDIGLDEM